MIEDIENLVSEVTQKLRDEVDIPVVGMSGGADSTLVAILCKLAFGGDNVYSVHMPMNKLDEDKFNSNSNDIAENLGLNIISCPIASISNAITASLTMALDASPSEVNAGNARSRSRMTILYGISHHLNSTLKKRARVIGTGNLSEDFIGYDTHHGDAACDYFPIGMLFKSEVYQLLEYFRDQGLISEKNIDRVPSAGLWDGQTDEQELGHSYNSMEPAIKQIMEWQFVENEPKVEHFVNTSNDPIIKFVYCRHIDNKFKHEAPKVTELRKFCK